MLDHSSRFLEAERNGAVFAITRRSFDEWCVSNGLMSACVDDVESGSELRDGLVHKRNQWRRAMNRSSMFALHGWPAYEIVADGDSYIVRLLEPLLDALPGEVAEKLGSLFYNKIKLVNRLGEEMATDTRLPPDIRVRFATNQRIFQMTAETCAFQIQRYLTEFSKDYRRSQTFLKKLLKPNDS
jgi:hypothetical protein